MIRGFVDRDQAAGWVSQTSRSLSCPSGAQSRLVRGARMSVDQLAEDPSARMLAASGSPRVIVMRVVAGQEIVSGPGSAPGGRSTWPCGCVRTTGTVSAPVVVPMANAGTTGLWSTPPTRPPARAGTTGCWSGETAGPASTRSTRPGRRTRWSISLRVAWRRSCVGRCSRCPAARGRRSGRRWGTRSSARCCCCRGRRRFGSI